MAESFDQEATVLRGPPIPNVEITVNGTIRVARGDSEVYEMVQFDTLMRYDLIAKRVAWLWPGRIPLGKLTLIEGLGKAGKSILAADIAARVTRGMPWPGRIAGPQLAGDVVYISPEDNKDDTLDPWLTDAGADVMRCTLLSGVSVYDSSESKKKSHTDRRFNFPADLPHLEHVVRQLEQTRLVVIDSLPELCADKKAYRETLRGLNEIAERRGVAVVVTARPSTRATARRPALAADKAADAVRCVFNVLSDPEDPGRRLLAPVRMNFCEEPEWLAFAIVGGRVVWETPGEGPPLSECIATPAEDRAIVLKEAVAWVSEMLKDEDVPASVMKHQAQECGISNGTLQRARRTLCVRSKRTGFGGIGWWTWSLKPGDEDPTGPPPPEEATNPDTRPGAAPPERHGVTRGRNGKARHGRSGPGSEFQGISLERIGRVLIQQILESGRRDGTGGARPARNKQAANGKEGLNGRRKQKH